LCYLRLKMSEVDEEVYTTIFNVLRNGVRRRILRMLSERQMNFTAINEKLARLVVFFSRSRVLGVEQCK